MVEETKENRRKTRPTRVCCLGIFIVAAALVSRIYEGSVGEGGEFGGAALAAGKTRAGGNSPDEILTARGKDSDTKVEPRLIGNRVLVAEDGSEIFVEPVGSSCSLPHCWERDAWLIVPIRFAGPHHERCDRESPY